MKSMKDMKESHSLDLLPQRKAKDKRMSFSIQLEELASNMRSVARRIETQRETT